MIMPLVRGYIKILSRLMGGININESAKKVFTLLVVSVLGGIIMELIYVLCFMVFTSRVLGTVLMGVYVFLLVGLGMWIILFSYVVLGNYVADNYKIVGLGVLPLVVFFVKVCGSFMVIWLVMIYAIFNML